MSQLGFSFNADACTGCKACVAACKDVHNLPVGYKLRHVVTGEAGSWEVDAVSGLLQPVGVFSYSVSYACMHCSAPACLAQCRQHAISKDADTGIVWIDQELCIGCGRCTKVCPWDAPVVVPRIDGSHTARKCDFCRDFLAAGEPPACVAACAMRCLQVVDFDATDMPTPASPSAAPIASTRVIPSAAPIAPVHVILGEARSAESKDLPRSNEEGVACEPRVFHDPLLADAPELEPNYQFTPHRGMVAHPGAEVRVHSMPEEYQNG